MKSLNGCLPVIALVALLLVAGPSRCGCSRLAGLREDAQAFYKSLTKKNLPPSKTEVLQQQWQQAQADLAEALKGVALASSAEAGMAKFKQAVEPEASVLKKARQIAADAAGSAEALRKRREFYGSPANEAALPAEVRPLLDQALSEHIAALDRIGAEISTLTRQLDSMGETLARDAATCQVQAKLNGEAAAKALWARKAGEVIQEWKKD